MLTFRYLEYPDRRAYPSSYDRDDRRSRKCLRLLGASACAMSGARSVRHAERVRVRGYGANDDRMCVLNEANVVDGFDVGFVLDVCIVHKQSGFHLPIVVDIVCCTTEELLLFSAELIVDLS